MSTTPTRTFAVLVPRRVGLADGGPALSPLFEGCTSALLRDIAGEGDGEFDLNEFEPVPLRRAADPADWTREQGIQRLLDEGRESCGDRRLIWLFSGQIAIPATWRQWWLFSATLWPIGVEKPYARSWGWSDGNQRWIQDCYWVSDQANGSEALLCRK
ncbi:MAG: hypothetical protein COU11_03700 [Candidatus Harrisonbacteria bacterium CG10_big_fil_rev_8_21_14_0_10_49_15]|uniref:Uncharacterized protein n=1 Tax=Candidatus Harrisonbacteria bacterium CG10_big_fil_rev_8_21_14_0_10_49_15 TaxID=1974587 RepID=A0A2H0UK55_9BACT|nr:MAG: hypothetical protein COU11_03700 [Candidatus Harrisonbacteria bacterium CG10_big_fil_rev_8_21_14_0_10_49_15]